MALHPNVLVVHGPHGANKLYFVRDFELWYHNLIQAPLWPKGPRDSSPGLREPWRLMPRGDREQNWWPEGPQESVFVDRAFVSGSAFSGAPSGHTFWNGKTQGIASLSPGLEPYGQLVHDLPWPFGHKTGSLKDIAKGIVLKAGARLLANAIGIGDDLGEIAADITKMVVRREPPGVFYFSPH